VIIESEPWLANQVISVHMPSTRKFALTLLTSSHYHRILKEAFLTAPGPVLGIRILSPTLNGAEAPTVCALVFPKLPS
jgi:hypothetical protein